MELREKGVIKLNRNNIMEDNEKAKCDAKFKTREKKVLLYFLVKDNNVKEILTSFNKVVTKSRQDNFDIFAIAYPKRRIREICKAMKWKYSTIDYPKMKIMTIEKASDKIRKRYAMYDFRATSILEIAFKLKLEIGDDFQNQLISEEGLFQIYNYIEEKQDEIYNRGI